MHSPGLVLDTVWKKIAAVLTGVVLVGTAVSTVFGVTAGAWIGRTFFPQHSPAIRGELQDEYGAPSKQPRNLKTLMGISTEAAADFLYSHRADVVYVDFGVDQGFEPDECGGSDEHIAWSIAVSDPSGRKLSLYFRPLRSGIRQHVFVAGSGGGCEWYIQGAYRVMQYNEIGSTEVEITLDPQNQTLHEPCKPGKRLVCP